MKRFIAIALCGMAWSGMPVQAAQGVMFDDHESFFRHVAADMSAQQPFEPLATSAAAAGADGVTVPVIGGATIRVGVRSITVGKRHLTLPREVALDLLLLRAYSSAQDKQVCLESPVARGGGAARWNHVVVLAQSPPGAPRLVHISKSPYGSCRAIFLQEGRWRAGTFSFVFVSEQSLAHARFLVTDSATGAPIVNYRLDLPDAGNAFQFRASRY